MCSLARQLNSLTTLLGYLKKLKYQNLLAYNSLNIVTYIHKSFVTSVLVAGVVLVVVAIVAADVVAALDVELSMTVVTSNSKMIRM